MAKISPSAALPTKESTSLPAASPAKRRRSEPASPRRQTAKKQKLENHDGDARPPCRGQPPVWASVSSVGFLYNWRLTDALLQTRGALNETLDYFRSPQGGMQTNEGFVRGMLLSGDNGDRSYLDGELLITRA